MKPLNITLAALASAALVSCTQTQQQWGLGGAAAGGVAGAILGDETSDIVRGAAIGGAAGVGGAAYKESQQNVSTPINTQPVPTPPQVTAPVAPTPTIPTATTTNVAGIVVSPFPPHNKVNVTGFQSGAKARDPYTKGVFMVP